MIAGEKLSALVDVLVIPDKKSAPGNVDRAATLKTLTAILQGGRDNIVGLVDMLVEPGKDDDSKARYALHALAVQVGAMKDEKQRQAFTEALASTLAAKKPAEVRGFVIRQLQIVGGKEVSKALGKLLEDEDVCDDAARALLSIRAGAAEQFRAALPKACCKTQLVIVQSLGTLRDMGSAKAIRELATEKDRDLRLTTLWALANIGDPDSVAVFLKASGAPGYERAKVASATLLLAERLHAAGQKTEAARLYTHLRDTYTDDSERHIKEAAIRGLASVK